MIFSITDIEAQIPSLNFFFFVNTVVFVNKKIKTTYNVFDFADIYIYI